MVLGGARILPIRVPSCLAPPPNSVVPLPFRCMSWGPDCDGVNGVYLGKNVVTCAGAAIATVIRQVGRGGLCRVYRLCTAGEGDMCGGANCNRHSPVDSEKGDSLACIGKRGGCAMGSAIPAQ